MTYHVINRKTGLVVGRYINKQRVRNAVDRKDNAYGAYIHFIQEVAS